MMVGRGETTFAIESFEPLMIEERWRRIGFRILCGLIYGLSIGVFYGVYFMIDYAPLAIGLSIGVSIGLSFGLDALRPIPQWRRTLIYGLSFGLSFGLVLVLIVGLIYGLSESEWLIYVLRFGLTEGSNFFLFIGIPLSFSMNYLNHNRRWSIKNALSAGIVGTLIFWLSYMLIEWLIYGYVRFFVLGLALRLFPIFFTVGGLRPSGTFAHAIPNKGFQSMIRLSLTVSVIIGLLTPSLGFYLQYFYHIMNISISKQEKLL